MPQRQVTAQIAENNPNVSALFARGIISITNSKIKYVLNKSKAYQWTDPEEWVRAMTVAFLIVEKGYPPNRMNTEVAVPRRTPNDYADLVVYSDDQCRTPYLVVENKPWHQRHASRTQAIEQLFGNTNSLRAPFGLYDDGFSSIAFDVANFPSTERRANRVGDRTTVPAQYGLIPQYRLIAGRMHDIKPVSSQELSTRIRRAHSVIWAGGRRDPLRAFDEWSKLLFAKIVDERSATSGTARRFQIGTNETTATVASRVHGLFQEGARQDPSIFGVVTRIKLPDNKVFDVVETIQDISFTRTDLDSLGSAFENFFGSVFRGELGQYFTMRPLARFIVALLDIQPGHFVIDPTAGSGGFLLEALMQVWERVQTEYAGQTESEIQRIRTDFALQRAFGVEIHDVLARICKINLLLHHDGHTNIEGDRSCLDSQFRLPRLQDWRQQFSRVVGNPPFGDDVEQGDTDKLGENDLASFEIARGRRKVPSEHVIIERSIEMLEYGGRFGLVVPDGLLNNQGEQSNCPRVRRFLARRGVLEAIVSLPDYAFRHSGAQNKTSILFFRRFTVDEEVFFGQVFGEAKESGKVEDRCIIDAHRALGSWVFLAEANHIGYLPTGVASEANDLYRSIGTGVRPDDRVGGTVLNEYRRFCDSPEAYVGSKRPACMGVSMADLWDAHASRRLDPKYHLFKAQESSSVPAHWVSARIGDVMERRVDLVRPEKDPGRKYAVMTISQRGEIRQREAGKGRNPPEWLGMYFEDSPSLWHLAHTKDVVYSSIDLWKGCVAVVPEDFDGALVTKEFPIYEITDCRLLPEFVSALLRSRYYQRAFRAITTGHSNRRRTQTTDFEGLEISFPSDPEEQRRLLKPVLDERQRLSQAGEALHYATRDFDAAIDGRRDEELSEIEIEK